MSRRRLSACSPRCGRARPERIVREAGTTRRSQEAGGSVNFFSLALLSTGAFISTNIDDLFLLVGFFSDRSFPRAHVFAGQILGMAAVVAISLAAATVALAISPAHVGLLGLAPIAIGI